MENGSDYIYIYDMCDNLLDVYTGKHEDLWTPWYSTGNSLKIETTTNPSIQSWGYKINEVKHYDLGENATATVIYSLWLNKPRQDSSNSSLMKSIHHLVILTRRKKTLDCGARNVLMYCTTKARAPAGHLPSMSAPSEFNEAVLSFLANV